MTPTLKNLSEIVARANDALYAQHPNVSTVMGIIDQSLRKQGLAADAITVDCLALDRKIVIFIRDDRPDSVDVALGNKAGDIHSCVSHPTDQITEAFMLQLMQDNFVKSLN